MRDKDFGIVRITSFGTYSFRVIEPARFIREVFGARKMNMTYDILQFLNSFVSEAITTVLAEAKIPWIIRLTKTKSQREGSDFRTWDRGSGDRKYRTSS